MLNDATGFKKIYLAAGLSSVYFYPQLFIFYYNYRMWMPDYYFVDRTLAFCYTEITYLGKF